MILENGLPTATTEKTKLGDQQANALVGLGSTLSYKGWSLNFLFDGRFGGHIFSGTLQSMQRAGTSAGPGHARPARVGLPARDDARRSARGRALARPLPERLHAHGDRRRR